MATPAQIRTAVDTRLTQLWTMIQNRQDAYLAAHGRYWQGLKSHSVSPADGATATPDVGSRCPTDQTGQPWPAGVLSAAMEMAIQIDTYDGPQGAGYQAQVWVTIAGQTWTRTAQVGPETWRALPWRQATQRVI